MQDRILIIEDDPDIAGAIAAEITALGCEPVHRDRLDTGIEEAARGDYRVIVLDRMLPGGDGIEAMARMRARGFNPYFSPIALLPTSTADAPSTMPELLPA